MTPTTHVFRTLAVASVSAVLLVACGSSVKLDDTPVESRSGSALTQPGADGQGGTRLIGSGSGVSGGAGGGAASQGAGSVDPNSQTNVATIQAGGAQGAGPGAGAARAGGSPAAAGGGSAGMGSPAAGGGGSTAGQAGRAGSSGAAGSSAAAGGPGSGTLAARSAGAASVTEGRVVYFDFDSVSIREDARDVVAAHARILTADPSRRLVIEGHTDERGSREYNLALGQKRADAVARALVLLGVREPQLDTVSFGEQRPAEQGAGESAWSKNRRAELKDRP